jgi:methylglyoxal synthase
MTTRPIALVAHDHKKEDQLEWADHNRELLKGHVLYATALLAAYSATNSACE